MEVGGFGARAVKETVEDGDVDVNADGAVPVGNVVVAHRRFPDRAESGDGGAPEIVLGAGEFPGRLDFQLQRLDFRTLLQGLLNEGLYVGSGRSAGSSFFDELEILFAGITENCGKAGESSLKVVARFEQEKFGAREFDFGEAEIQFGLEFRVGESLDFIDEGLPGFHGLFRDAREGLRVQRIVEGLVDGQENVRAGSGGILILGFGGELGTGKQVGGAAKIRNELADGGAFGSTREKDGIVEETGSEAAARIGVHGSQAQVGIGQESGARFADILLRSEGTQAADGDLRIVLDGCGFGLRQGERRAGRRGLCRGWGVPWVRGRLRFGEAAGDREQQRNATGWTNHGRTARASSLPCTRR